MSETPPSIQDNTFPIRTSQTLFVPKGCKSVYLAADYWWGFKEIKEIGEVNSNLRGDVNGDGLVNMSDVTEIINIILGK